MSFKPPRFFKNILSILGSSGYSVAQYPVIFLPFIFTAFIQLLILEILYFIPQYPNDIFFAPIIRRIWGEAYLHYPSNFYLLPQLFQDIGIPIAILIGSFFTAMAVAIIAKINDGEDIVLKETAREVFKQYVHIVIAALLAFLLVFFLLKGYSLIYNRALLIRSTEGNFYLLKRSVIDGGVYFAFLLSVLSTTLMAYVLPIIVIDKKKVFTAVWGNFKLLTSVFWPTFMIVLLCSLLFIPAIVLKILIAKGALVYEWILAMIVLDVLLMMVINAMIYTSVTTVYLSKKEESK